MIQSTDGWNTGNIRSELSATAGTSHVRFTVWLFEVYEAERPAILRKDSMGR